MTFGLESTGFTPKRLNDVLTDAETGLALVEDPVTRERLQPDFESSDPVMQIVQIPLEAVAENWQIAQVAYNAYNPSMVTGAAQRGLVQLNGITIDPGAASSVVMLITGTANQVITATTELPLVMTDTAQLARWIIVNDFTIGAGGTISITAMAESIGPTQAAANSITSIVTPLSGITSVNNPAGAVIGRALETPTQLRTRRRNSTLAPSAGPAESVFSNLLNVTGVTFARVYINNRLTTDARGIAAKSQLSVVVGGDDNDIARTLMARSGAGVEFVGTSLVVLADLQGETYDVRWTRPTLIPIFVTVNISTNDRFPTNGAALIQQAIIDYAREGAAGLGINTGFRSVGFTPGASVDQSRLYTPVNSVPGHAINSLFIGTSPSPTLTAPLPIALDAQSQFLAVNIIVTVS